jgi:hypothetical protein
VSGARRGHAIAFACGLAVAFTRLLSPDVALAYCRTSTCLDCKRDPATGCTKGGKPIAWPNACVSFSVNRNASTTIDLDGASRLMAEAFATWESARCGDEGKRPSIFVSQAFGPAQCGKPEFNPNGGNANLIVFRDETWPYGGAGHELAATQLTFDDEGRIYDADIEINATGPLALPAPDDGEADGGVAPDAGAPDAGDMIAYGIIAGEHDLLSIMTHEAGHFLGLDHSREENAIMLAELSPGQVRTQLTADDEAAICAAYPPDREVLACDPAPRGGFSSACDDTGLFGGCSVARPRQSSWVELLGLASIAAALQWRRARKRGRR